MSFGMMLYKPPRHLTHRSRKKKTSTATSTAPNSCSGVARTSPAPTPASAVASANKRANKHANKHANKRGTKDSYIDHSYFTDGGQTGTNPVENNYVISKTRSIALPLVFALAMIGLILSFVNPAVARAADPATGSNSDSDDVVLQFCQTSGQDVTCPVDMLPIATISHAEITLRQSADAISTNSAESRSRCALMSRHSMGGQARGIAVSTRRAGNDLNAGSSEQVLALPALDSAMDEFRYIECRLAPGTTITKVHVVGGKQEINAATRSEARSDWTLLSSKAEKTRPLFPQQ